MSAEDFCMPEERLPTLPALVKFFCERGISPSRMSSLLISWMQTAFGTSSNRMQLEGYNPPVWLPDRKTTPLRIIPFYSYVHEATGEAINILVQRNDVGFKQLAIGSLSKEKIADGTRSYHEIAYGSHSIYVLGRRPLAVEMLALEAWNDIKQFAPVAQAALGLYRLQVPQWGKLFSITAVGDVPFYVSPFSVYWALGYSWELKPEAMRTDSVPVVMTPST